MEKVEVIAMAAFIGVVSVGFVGGPMGVVVGWGGRGSGCDDRDWCL